MKKLFTFLLLALCLNQVAFAVQHPSKHHAIAAWIAEDTKGVVTEKTALKYVHYAFESAERWEVDPLLLLAIMKPESRYKANAKNRSGASGLMQVIPKWHRAKIKGRNIFNPKTNIDVAAQILNEYLEWNRENLYRAIQKYNGGARSHYVKNVKKTYKELRQVVTGWHFMNEEPMQAEYHYDKPRNWAASRERYVYKQMFAQSSY